jgi:hypothetical protein
MFEFVLAHQFWSAVVLYWIFSAAVSSMPDPTANGNPGYSWLYRFLHTIAGNLTTALSEAARYRAGASVAGKIPGLKTLAFILIVPFLLVTPACAMHIPVHPGALDTIDSVAYDTLLSAQAAIDQARLDFKSGRLPAQTKPGLDALVSSYNVARASWLTYRDAISTNASADEYLARLNQNLIDLTTAMRGLHQKEAK